MFFFVRRAMITQRRVRNRWPIIAILAFSVSMDFYRLVYALGTNYPISSISSYVEAGVGSISPNMVTTEKPTFPE